MVYSDTSCNEVARDEFRGNFLLDVIPADEKQTASLRFITYIYTVVIKAINCYIFSVPWSSTKD